MPESLIDIFYPSGKVIGIVGKRSSGISLRDEAIFSMLKSKLAGVETIQGNLPLNKLIEKTNGHVFSSGGAPNIYSILAQYPPIIGRMEKNPDEVYAFTLEDMMNAIKEQPEVPPIRWIYHTPVLETLQKADSKILERLMQVMGIKEIGDYKKLRFLPDIPDIGHTDVYKNLGITVPLWRVETTAVRQSAEQKPLTLHTQEYPFVEAYDPFLILAGINLVNPNYNMITFVGGRGQSTFAAELVAVGKDQVSREELDKVGLENASCYIAPNKTHHIEGVQSFLNDVSKELNKNLASCRYGDRFKGRYNNVAILGIVHTKGNLPLSVSGPIDIRFYNPMK